MPSPRFLLKTDLLRFEPVPFRGGDIQNQYARVRSLLAEKAPAAAELFAEPVAGGNAISWYGEGTGEPQPLTALSASRRAEAELLLMRRLAPLAALLDDTEAGPLLRRALVIAEPAAIVALDDAVLLTGWGMVPRGDLSDEALAAQVRATLGRYAPFLATVDASFAAAVRPLRSRVAVAPVDAAPRGPAPSTHSPLQPTTLGPATRRIPWLAPLLASVAVLFLLLGVGLTWWHLTHNLSSRITTAEVVDVERTRLAIQLQRETNAQLERDVERARHFLAAPNICTPEVPLGLAPQPEQQPIRPETVPPSVPAQSGGRAEAFTGSLAQLLERATVMVVSAGPQGIAHGTGFFVAGDTIVTNAHVVETADPAQIYIMSHAIGRAIRVELANTTPSGADGHSEPGNPDFAVLHLAQPVPGAQPLALSRTAEKLTDVVAAGYPASVVRMESGMQALREGRLGEPPELVLTRGSISTIQNLPNGLVVMPHSADISPGNSGGPLVDSCGRVVGINTFVSRATEVADRVKYAQKTDSLLPWLTQNGVQPHEDGGACNPLVPGSPTLPPQAAPAASTR